MFNQKVVIVTGGANGIGKVVAENFANQGAHVVIADIDESGERVVKSITNKGLGASFIKTNVQSENEIIRLVESTVNLFGSIDIVINNAGVSKFKPLLQLQIEEWDEIINSNLRSVFLISKESSKHMCKGSSIVNIASTRAFMSERHSEAYAASKGGIIALTHALAASLDEKQIRVNSISPGWIQTSDYEQLRLIDHEQHFSKRVGKPEDVVKACFYLCNPDNDFVNAENIVIDGGMTRKMMYEK